MKRRISTLVELDDNGKYISKIHDPLLWNGFIPSSIKKLKKIEDICCKYHQLRYDGFEQILNIESLKKIKIVGCLKNSHIPEFGRLTNLKYLNLSSNGLTGNIPNSIKNSKNLKYMILKLNRLKFNELICELTNLVELDFSSNELNQISYSIGNLTNLSELNLKSNIIKNIPKSISNLKKLEVLDVSENKLRINIIEPVLGLKNLKKLDLSFNEIEDEITNLIENLIHLENVNLCHNKIKGNLPSSIEKLTKLKFIDLSYIN